MSNKGKSWLIGVFSFFVILFIFLRLVILFWINPLVDKILKESVSIYSDGLYQVTYNDLKVKPLERRLVLENFNLSFDSTLIGAASSSGNHIFVKASAGNVEIAVGNLGDLFFNRYFLIKQLYLHEPSVFVYNYTDSIEQEPDEPFDAYALIKDYFDSVHVEVVEIREASFSLKNISGKPFRDFALEHVNASIANMVIDSGTVYRNFGYPKAEQFSLVVEDAHYSLPDTLYQVSIGRAAFYPVLESVVLSDVRLTPQWEKHKMASTLGYRKDWIDVVAAQVKLDRIDLHKLIVDNVIHVERMTLDSACLQVFRDRRMKSVGQHENIPLLSEVLHQVSVPFKFDTIALKNSSVLYEEQAPSSQVAGKISFNRIYASIYNTSNIDSINQQRAMEADVRAQFMGKSLLTLSFDFPLNSPHNRHRVTGRLEKMPLDVMNCMLEPVMFTSIQSGVSHLLEFEMEADNEKATGMVNFIYTDLKIALLNQKSPEEDPKLKHKVGSVIANLFVIKTDNPSGTQPLRKGVINFPRDKEQSIFSYWSHAILSGLKISVGLENEPELLSKVEEESENNASQPKEKKKGLLKRIFKGKDNK